jgi:hypothetical protein
LVLNRPKQAPDGWYVLARAFELKEKKRKNGGEDGIPNIPTVRDTH